MEALLAARPAPNVIAERFSTRAVYAHPSNLGLMATLAGATDIAELNKAVCGTEGVVPAGGVGGIAPTVVGVCLCKESEGYSCLSD